MATWVQIPSGSSGYFSSGTWIADMGPYTGPWPLMAPAIVEHDSDETDFYLALPNPATPDDVTTVGDGSYATDFFAAYRYILSGSTDTRDGYYDDHVPWGGPSSQGTAFVSGMHLYVLTYYSGTPPHPPEFYVPPTYAAGGNAAYRTDPGGWSDELPGPEVEHSGYGPLGPGSNSYFDYEDWQFVGSKEIDKASGFLGSDPYPFPAVDLRTLEVDARNQITTRATPLGPNSRSSSDQPYFLGWSQEKTDTLDTGPSHSAKWRVAADGRQQYYGQFADLSRIDTSEYGLTLVYNVDYENCPYPDLNYESFKYNGTPTVTWYDLVRFFASSLSYGPYLNRSNESGRVDSYSVTIDLYVCTDQSYFVGSGGGFPPHTTGYIPPSAMTHIGSFTISGTIDRNTTFSSTSAITGNPAVPLSTLVGSGGFFALVWQPRFLTDGSEAVPITNEPEPNNSSYGYEGFALGLTVDNTVLFTDTSTYPNNTGIPYTKHNPPWRYWKINPIVPTGAAVAQFQGWGVPI